MVWDTDWRVPGSMMNDNRASAMTTDINTPSLTRIFSRSAIYFYVLIILMKPFVL